MATPGMLVREMARTLGVPEPTITQFDRVLAENGLRSKSGRGTSAAQVTARDAANLLIAIMASPVHGAAVRDAALTCQTYGGMQMHFLPKIPPIKFAKYGLHSLKKLTVGCDFLQTLEALIREAADGGEFKDGDGGPDYDDRKFSIMVEGPSPSASFQVWTRRLAAELYFSRLRGMPWYLPDMQQRRLVSYRTIRRLGTLLSGQPELMSGSRYDDDSYNPELR
jgi:hypothetical protein